MTEPVDPPPPNASLPILIHPEELLQRTWVELYRAHHWAARRSERMAARHGLSMAQFDVLATLLHSEGVRQQQLADLLLVTKGNICMLVERMTTRGWVERRPDPEDRRANRLYLTNQGRELIEKTLPEHQELIRESLGKFRFNELWTLQEMLSRIGPKPGPDSSCPESSIQDD